jgi:hypothetical protein
LAAAGVRGGEGVWPTLVRLSAYCPSCRGGLGLLAEFLRRVVRPPLFSRRRRRCCGVVGSSSSLAGRGGEGRRRGFACFSAGCDVPRRAAVACAPLLARWLLRQALPLRLPPPARGWCGESDGGSFDSIGFGVAPLSASYIQLLWCWKLYSPSSTSSAGHSRQAPKILRGSICKPAITPGNQTSFERPSSRSATAFNVGLEASGVVPASYLDGSWPDLKLGVG